jgi:hypothetical protein
MTTVRAGIWDDQYSKKVADELAVLRAFCGPTVVVWIAAVWNHSKGRPYDYKRRLTDRSLFADGPRLWDRSERKPPGISFQTDLETALKRETNNELGLSNSSHHKYGTIYRDLKRNQMPVIIRMALGVSTLWKGLHYVTCYKIDFKEVSGWFDKMRFYWQDNGVYGNKNGGNKGLYNTAWRNVGESQFLWGSRQVVVLR